MNMVIRDNKLIGNLGEEIACRFLMKRGFTIIGRNYLRKWGEIDIIAYRGKTITFVEVKSKSCATLANVIHETCHRPEENVHFRKQQRLKRVMQTYLHERHLENREWNFMVMAVYLDQVRRLAKVRLLEDIIL